MCEDSVQIPYMNFNLTVCQYKFYFLEIKRTPRFRTASERGNFILLLEVEKKYRFIQNSTQTRIQNWKNPPYERLYATLKIISE